MIMFEITQAIQIFTDTLKYYLGELVSSQSLGKDPSNSIQFLNQMLTSCVKDVLDHYNNLFQIASPQSKYQQNTSIQEEQDIQQGYSLQKGLKKDIVEQIQKEAQIELNAPLINNLSQEQLPLIQNDYAQKKPQCQQLKQKKIKKQQKNSITMTRIYSSIDFELIASIIEEPVQAQELDNFLQDLQADLSSHNQERLAHTREKIVKILQIKKKTQKYIPKTPFPQRIQQLRKMNEKEIKKIIWRCSQKDSFINQKEVEQLQKIVEKECKKYEQICLYHYKNIYYICCNQTKKDRIYLCNQCMSSIKQNENIHQGHQICCIKHHNQPINFRLLKFQQQQFYFQHLSKAQLLIQQFFCNKCKEHNTLNKTKRRQSYNYLTQASIVLISKCHFENASEICFEAQCIKKDQFIICPICEVSKHNGHPKAIFNKRSLMKELNIEKQINIGIYEQLFLDLRQILKAKFTTKKVNFYYEQISMITKYLQSFVVHGNTQLQRWVQLVINEGSKQAMLVLLGVKQLKMFNYSDEDKQNYLDVCIYLLKGNSFQQFLSIIGKDSQQQINYFLSKKYKSFVDIQDKDTCIISPSPLEQINPNHYHRIKQINVKKQSEEIKNEIIAKQMRFSKSNFFNHQIKKILKQFHMNQKQQQTILQLFAQQDYINLNKLGKRGKYRNQIMKLKQILDTNKVQYQILSKKCFIFNFISQYKLVNLKVIQIQYELENHLNNIIPAFRANGDHLGDKYRYSISAFVLFQVIQMNQQLQLVAINGVYIQKMSEFMQQLRNNKTQQQTFNNQQKALWIQKVNPRQSLKLAINTRISFNFYNQRQIALKIDQFNFFCNCFPQLSGITAEIRLGTQAQTNRLKHYIQKLSNKLNRIHKLKVAFFGYCIDFYHQGPYFFIEIILKEFSRLKQIVQLQLSYISFSKFTGQEFFKKMEYFLRVLFQNNPITTLKLCTCKNFPALPNITSILSIQLIDVSFRQESSFMRSLIKNNPQLKFIKCFKFQQKWGLNESTLNNLTTLSIFDCDGLSIGSMSQSFSSLKYILIKGSKIDAYCLQKIFPKLVNLAYLQLRDINFGHDLLELIPSTSLQELHIHQNEQIKNKDLEVLDCKWPYLRALTLRQCPRLNSGIFRICNFCGLIELQIDKNIFNDNDWAFFKLKSKGIRVFLHKESELDKILPMASKQK